MNNTNVVTGPGVDNSIYHKISSLLCTWELMHGYNIQLTNIQFVNWLINGELTHQVHPLLHETVNADIPENYTHGLHIRLYLKGECRTTSKLSKVVATIYHRKLPLPTFTVAGLNDNRSPLDYLDALSDILENTEDYLPSI